MMVRLHAFEPISRANGPGLRAVVWFQGCTLCCPGCFNPATHDPTAGDATDTTQLATEILALGPKIEGLSVSGGEPFQQPEALLDLLTRLTGSRLSRLVFTGYTLKEVESSPLGPAILPHIDVLIAGRYDMSRPSKSGLLGSSNQQIHLLTDRYRLTDLAACPGSELILHADGSVTATGVHPWQSSRGPSLPLSPMRPPRPQANNGE